MMRRRFRSLRVSRGDRLDDRIVAGLHMLAMTRSTGSGRLCPVATIEQPTAGLDAISRSSSTDAAPRAIAACSAHVSPDVRNDFVGQQRGYKLAIGGPNRLDCDRFARLAQR